MSRIRTVKPELFRHEDLFDAEITTGLPLRLAFVGMLTVADCEGRFIWKPRTLKLDVLPHDVVDFSAVLVALEQHGFVESYTVSGIRYGWIPSFKKHQQIPTKESERGSHLPPRPPNAPVNHEEIDDPVPVQGEARTDPVPVQGEARTGIPGRGREEEGKRKGKGKEWSVSPPSAPRPPSRKTACPADLSITPELQAWADQHGYRESMAAHLESFVGKATANGYAYADWQAALRNAIRDDWAGLRKPPPIERAVPGGGRAREKVDRVSADPRIAEVQQILAGATRAVIEGECAHVTH